MNGGFWVCADENLVARGVRDLELITAGRALDFRTRSAFLSGTGGQSDAEHCDEHEISEFFHGELLKWLIKS